ncbi:hypothetical protein LVY72_05115 [Arthrobacter sp. I2-34]|uniref:PA14 domain-containing protein n=1 Tax=Arthrobacter hankyongi TaxID=2904801 RepID=A0ABS9L470_9MICC|nr:hypothetical protein [Arthrobacter hankyongi]MCG2621292.1 hypothetical protein [Arthrobacter hankyongi]
MLTSLDESLYHQSPLLFQQAAVTDHRFYDRYAYTTMAPDGSAALLTGMGVYKNLNVMDGFVTTQAGQSVQRNIRISRPLRPIVEPLTLGPMRTEFPVAFQETRMICEPNEYGDAFDLTFRPVFTRLENPHYGETDGRVTQDYRRFSQVGWTSGTLVVDGQEHTLDKWFGWRDHSWGVRPGVGGFEPFTGTRNRGGIPSASRGGGLGILLVYVAFATDSYSGFFFTIEDENGKRIYLDGAMQVNGEEPSEIVDGSHEIKFIPGTRLYSTMSIQAKTADGQVWDLDVEAIGRAWVYRGTGYDHGWNDTKGLGAWRGDELTVETDVYGVGDVEETVMPDGGRIRPIHREQPVRVRVRGEEGNGHSPLFVVGPNRVYGLEER